MRCEWNINSVIIQRESGVIGQQGGIHRGGDVQKEGPNGGAVLHGQREELRCSTHRIDSIDRPVEHCSADDPEHS